MRMMGSFRGSRGEEKEGKRKIPALKRIFLGRLFRSAKAGGCHHLLVTTIVESLGRGSKFPVLRR
jgi:hypothetical protein